jgi:hypothetical protein
MLKFFMDRKYRLPRVWSNRELEKIAPLCTGDIVNVSAWKDWDKERRHYRDYFQKASQYFLTNFEPDKRGFQGGKDEIFLDLSGELPVELRRRFDVVFNHTVLEHVFEIDRAFSNLCEMSRDLVIVVVPFLQPIHGEYGDFWRLSPQAVLKMFAKNGFKVTYLNYNRDRKASVYVFAVGTRQPEKWLGKFPAGADIASIERLEVGDSPDAIGNRAIPNTAHSIGRFFRKTFGIFFTKSKEDK